MEKYLEGVGGGKNHLEDLGLRWEDNIKMDLKIAVWVGVYWSVGGRVLECGWACSGLMCLMIRVLD
jgi:hypothetical protein